MKDCLAYSSLGCELMMSVDEDKSLYTYTHPYTRHFIWEACYGGRYGADIQDFESSAVTPLLNVKISHLNFQNRW